MKKKYSTIIILLAVWLTACTKVINIDLKDKSGQFVIEGNITSQPPPYYVKISKSGAFSNETGFETINNALVIISDNLGTVDTLTWVSNGYYKTNKITGTRGATYKMNAAIGTTVFTAESTMPSPVNFDTLVVFEEAGSKYLLAVYKDQEEVNYYRFKTTINGKPSGSINIFDDKLNNGMLITQPLNDMIKSGDSVTVNMTCIDEPVYNYFFGVDQIAGMGESATPVNPVSNIHGGCLGYFSAQTQQQRSIIIP